MARSLAAVRVFALALASWLAGSPAGATVVFESIVGDASAYASAVAGSLKDKPGNQLSPLEIDSLADALAGSSAVAANQAHAAGETAVSSGAVAAQWTTAASGAVTFTSSTAASVADAGGVAKAATNEEFTYDFDLTTRELIKVSWSIDDRCGPLCGGYVVSTSNGSYSLPAGLSSGSVGFVLDSGAGWLDVMGSLIDYAAQSGPGVMTGGSALSGDRFSVIMVSAPEPSTWAMLLLGFASVSAFAPRMRRL